MDLYIGRLDEDTEEEVAEAAPDIGTAWRVSAAEIGCINLLNLASVVAFLAHATELEGLDGVATGATDSRFKNLPWWEFCVWLPVELGPARLELLSDSALLGSAYALRRELDELRALSPLHLGTIPRGYAEMRADGLRFARTEFATDDVTATIQWVWLGLRDAAGLAIEHTAPIKSW